VVTRHSLTMVRVRCGVCCMPIPERAGVIPRSLLRDHAYRSIRDAIVDGTLVPGGATQ